MNKERTRSYLCPYVYCSRDGVLAEPEVKMVEATAPEEAWQVAKRLLIEEERGKALWKHDAEAATQEGLFMGIPVVCEKIEELKTEITLLRQVVSRG